MRKLLDKFNASRSLADARRLANYHYKHPFAQTALTMDDVAVLTDAIKMARSAPPLSRPAKDLAPTREQWAALIKAEVSQ